MKKPLSWTVTIPATEGAESLLIISQPAKYFCLLTIAMIESDIMESMIQ